MLQSMQKCKQASNRMWDCNLKSICSVLSSNNLYICFSNLSLALRCSRFELTSPWVGWMVINLRSSLYSSTGSSSNWTLEVWVLAAPDSFLKIRELRTEIMRLFRCIRMWRMEMSLAGDACTLAAQPNELQQEEEQAHYVQIEVEGSEHVLLGRNLIFPVLAAQDELRVTHQILQRQRRDA